MQKFVGFARKSAGGLMTAGTGTFAVYQPGTTTPVTVYTTDSTSVPVSSFTIPVTGKIEFYARNGDLKVTATEGAETVTVDDITLNAGVRIGTLASRPAAGSPDLLYLATDVGRVYYDDGSAWSLAIDFAKDAMDWGPAADVVIAAGTNDVFGGAGNYVELTNASGSPAITALANNNAPEGSPRLIKFTISGGAPSLTHNATSLEITGSANWTPANGDWALVVGKGGSNVRVHPLPLSGVPTGLVSALAAVIADAYLGTSTTKFLTPAALPGNVNSRQATTSGTSIDFTGLPANLKKFTVNFEGVSTSGTSNLMVQLGTSGGIQATGYNGCVGNVTSAPSSGAANHSTGFNCSSNTAAADVMHGSLTFTLTDPANHVWAVHGVLGQSNSARVNFLGGTKSLAAALDRIRITTVGGSDTFDAGAVSISY